MRHPHPRRQRFVIYIRELNGPEYRVFTDANDTIQHIKEKVRDEVGIVPEMQIMLVFMGRDLQDGRRISEYNIANESVVHLVRKGVRS